MITSTYNNLMTGYMAPATSTNNIHKQSELKTIYKSIKNLSKSSPLYKLDLSEDNQRFALNLKDTAISYAKELEAYDFSQEGSVNFFEQATAQSEDPEAVFANLTSSEFQSLPESINIQINSLASPQINSGEFVSALYNGGRSGGTYKIGLKIEDSTYNMTFEVKPSESNESILNNFANFINRQNLDIKSRVVRSENGNYISLETTSLSTGSPDEDTKIFSFSDLGSPPGEPGLVFMFGLDNTTQMPTNAHFVLNGEERSTLSNEFILNGNLEISLQKPTDKEVAINYIADGESILPYIEEFVNGYNRMLDISRSYPSTQGLDKKLANELKNSLYNKRNEMESVGLSFDENDKLVLDSSIALQAIQDGDMEKLFASPDSFTKSLQTKLNSIIINPMNYVDKTVVTYPNIAKPDIRASQPYITSMYSGMLFNSYC
ncbi:MAG: hypothetical protein K6G65_11085 [Lachnospiraceae bacterium]|nr:hypothetical protein [Lachnospiraceae bacterium]